VSSWGLRNLGDARYDRFTTGLTFREVKRMMFDNHQDRSRWRYKRRHTVLGAWHAIKLSMWEEFLRRGGATSDV
jgi:hypothetical protein